MDKSDSKADYHEIGVMAVTEVDDRKTNENSKDDTMKSEQSFGKDDSDIQITEDYSTGPNNDSNVSASKTNVEQIEAYDLSSGIIINMENVISGAEFKTINIDKNTESESIATESSSTILVKEDEQISETEGRLMNTKKETTVVDNSQDSECNASTSTQHSSTEAKPQTSNGANHLNQAAIKLLQRLEFKNPGRKQIEYGLFNPEESEREKKKLRRFQASKPRAGVCYKDDGMLLDGRDICDCLTETCPGCFYPCPQCTSKKCGPTCRCNRKWVYDYIEDEGRTYRVEFPEQMNF